MSPIRITSRGYWVRYHCNAARWCTLDYFRYSVWYFIKVSLLSRMQHPNVVRYHQAWIEGGFAACWKRLHVTRSNKTLFKTTLGEVQKSSLEVHIVLFFAGEDLFFDTEDESETSMAETIESGSIANVTSQLQTLQCQCEVCGQGYVGF